MAEGYRIESLLSARLFMSPQLAGGRIYFISDLGGRLSLYVMDRTGSVPEPLLPPDISLQNPTLMESESFFVFPALGRVLVMVDQNGDENYQPMFVPLEGGIPQPAFGDRFRGQQVMCAHADGLRNLAVFTVDNRRDADYASYLADLQALTLTDLGSSIHGNFYLGGSDDLSRLILADSYLQGDEVLYLWEGAGSRQLLYGVPLEDRRPGEEVRLNGIGDCVFTSGDGLLFVTALHDDCYGLGYLLLSDPGRVHPVSLTGTVHQGTGEFTGLRHVQGMRYLLTFNIDGVSWAYEGVFSADQLAMSVDRVVVGHGELSDGKLQSIMYDRKSDAYALSHSTATSPAQLYVLDRHGWQIHQVTRQRILGIRQEVLSAGEDASFTSHDGLRVSARLYLPSPLLSYQGARPVVFYVHGGPQGQEHPDFTWFSMPLIQYLTLKGFAVFVPNVRGSTGYGLDYTRRVDRDWGGKDRLDHVAAHAWLARDARLDMARVAIVGRSYGGYMTLTQVGRHPELWQAGCDMFGPFNLETFIRRLPQSWQTHFKLAVGDPDTEQDVLAERSPSTYLHQMTCPLLVIQGRNDPRVVEMESRDLVETLRSQGKRVEYLVFENEGHDVIKYENKVRCYNRIADFFAGVLQP